MIYGAEFGRHMQMPPNLATIAVHCHPTMLAVAARTAHARRLADRDPGQYTHQHADTRWTNRYANQHANACADRPASV